MSPADKLKFSHLDFPSCQLQGEGKVLQARSPHDVHVALQIDPQALRIRHVTVVYGVPRYILSYLRQLLDNWVYIFVEQAIDGTVGSQQPPIPIAPTPVVLKTIFVEQALQGTESSRMRATITAINYGTGSRFNDDPSILFHFLSIIFPRCTLLYLYLRQLLDRWPFKYHS